MAKAAKTAQKKDPKQAAEAKNYSKVIKAVRSPKSGAYTFKEAMIHKDKVKDFLSQKWLLVINNFFEKLFNERLLFLPPLSPKGAFVIFPVSILRTLSKYW